MNLLAVALATGAVFFAISYFGMPARAGSTRTLKKGKRYRFTGVVKPPFPDEGSAQAEEFLAQLQAATVFGAGGASFELERVENFPGESRLVFLATAVQTQRLALPDKLFAFDGREFTLLAAEDV